MTHRSGMTHEPPSPYHDPAPASSHTSVLNLVLGGISFSIAAAMAGAALRLAGSQTLVGIIAAAATAVAFLVLWNLRIHRQPHGLFLCASLLCMGGAAVALGHALYVGDLLKVETKSSGAPRVITGERQAALPSPPPHTLREPTAVATPAPASPSVDAEDSAAPAPRKSPEWMTQWRASQAQAMERYPALAIRDARENKAFVGAYQTLRNENPAYFDDPEWPLRLAEALAERDGWERGDGIIEERPTESSPASPDTPDSGFEDR